MKKFTKRTSALLALLMLGSAFTPVYASKLEVSKASYSGVVIENDSANGESLEIDDSSDGSLSHKDELEISEVRGDLLEAQKAVEGIEVDENDKEYKEVLEKYGEAVTKLDGEINDFEAQLRQRGSISNQKGSGIYDVTSIPSRVQLLIRIGRAIRFGTTELSNKVVAAHTKLTEYIMVGILHTLNPFVQESTIMEYIASFDALEQELLSYPDLSPEDIATIYKKSAYHRVIAEARKVRNEANRTGRKFQAQELNKVISESAALWWRITVTCGELDAQQEKLEEAIEKVAGPKIRVKSVEFMEGNKGAISLDKKTKISPVLLPVEAKNKDYIITSSNPYVARVIGGEIVPIKTGSVKIECVSKDSAVKGVFELTVLKPGKYSSLPMLEATGTNDYYMSDGEGNNIDPVPPVGNDTKEVKDISFTAPSAELKVNEEYDLKKRVLVFPERAEDKSLTFTSQNPEVASVSEDGIVSAVSEGTCKIKVSTNNGIEKYFVVKVNEEKEALYNIEKINTTERKGGIFKVEVTATENENPYNGPFEVTLTSEDKTVTKRAYMNRGKGEVSFNGFDFGVWKKDFKGEVSLKDVTREFEIKY
ncbi:CAMP factor family pore-forming toxin [Peptoniphilus sp.]|jgi:uncharacterized protein YjdB|uniref:CAMP factor family pore-forming toxin n=1 Tax=Peptoniphilus sp. TaxID=1971214 RepID=UPI003D8CBDA1